MENETTVDVTENVEDKTSENETQDTNVQTLQIQKDKWREKALDPETGKTYKELYEESLKNKSKTSTKKETTDEFGLLQRTFLNSAGVTAEDEVELAREIQDKTKMDWPVLVNDGYFKSRLEELRQNRANAQATSGIRGNKEGSDIKSKPEYWLAKGRPPSKEEVTDRKTRTSITKAFMKNANEGKRFYND